ncbi:MAG TPA: DinB family protein [Candidatus Limnocylindrales bacterium]|nr:DinB family protein [Candidatus Limnocylindrales bacterium]
MTRSILADAFDHHVWATLVVLDLLAPLSDEQLATTVPGTYGTILDTARHLVGSDRWYLFVQTDGAVDAIAEEEMSVAQLREAMAPDAASWAGVLAANHDPDDDKVLHRDDGSEAHATWGVRLAQALDHGTDHRSQICTALTTIGIQPPEIDVWAWALTVGKHRVTGEPAA